MTEKLFTQCRQYGQREFNMRETLNLLQRYGYRFLSWGSHSFSNIDNKSLVFKVNGHHHKGYVCINLGWDDTYTVRLLSTHGTVKFEMEGVYFDMLFDVLDRKIERIPEYEV